MTKGTSMRKSARIAGLIAAVAAVAAAPNADAQVLSRFALRLEGGAGTMLSEHQRATLGFDGVAIQGSARIAFSFVDALALQVGVASWWFPANSTTRANNGLTGDMGRSLAVTGGLHFEPQIGRVGRLFVSANVGPAFTGDDTRFYLDAGIGFEFRATPWLGIGPVFRYGQVFQSTQDLPAGFVATSSNDPNASAQFFSGGLSIALRGPRDEAGPGDRDSDGVNDTADQCPDTPQGSTPDAARPGCPAGDRDNDGVVDGRDQCPDEPAGAHPDPDRYGCPARATDRDGDGVMDADDQCPAEPQGPTPDATRRGCPARDQDADGVLDPDDQCPAEPQGTRPDPNRRGCPVHDRDNDGIADEADRCPDQPETFNGRDDTDGCPDGQALAESTGTQIRILQQVNFRTNSAEITGTRSFNVLDAVSAILSASPQIAQVDIQGPTDDRGSAERNRTLSNERANSVRQYLSQHGVAEGRLVSHGFGPDCPLEAGRSRRAREANRRVQFVIVGPDQPAGRCVGGAAAAVTAPAEGTPAAPEEGSRRHRRHRRRH
ncbi:MAG: OmpA family protein [Burkholderiales bacterium]|nr:OmpA family protein [Burkholderiales bacterium]